MLLRNILEATSLPFAETSFRQAPKTSYIVWFDTITRRGADMKNCINEHDVRLEVYAYKIDCQAEARIENVLDSLALPFVKEERQWLPSEQLFLVIYTFNYTEKEVN